MRKVVNVHNHSQEMGYVKGNTFYNKNGATKTFPSEGHMINWLKSYRLVILD
jgi:hypothetical protein